MRKAITATPAFLFSYYFAVTFSQEWQIDLILKWISPSVYLACENRDKLVKVWMMRQISFGSSKSTSLKTCLGHITMQWAQQKCP